MTLVPSTLEKLCIQNFAKFMLTGLLRSTQLIQNNDPTYMFIAKNHVSENRDTENRDSREPALCIIFI